MSVLLLVRHGQASFLAANYDVLSPLGEEQGRLLGAYWARHGLRFDAVYTGPGERHRGTAAAAASACAEADHPLPHPEVIEELHEYDWDALIAAALPDWRVNDPELDRLALEFEAASGAREQRRAFQKLFERMAEDWVRERYSAPGIEPWHEFARRVRGALDRIVERHGGGQRVAAFTSGGPAAVAVQRALEVAPVKTLELVWALRNCALVEFLYSGDRFSLSAFNAAPHLDDARLWTYR